METSGNDGEGKKDLDDSGCVQDVGPPPQQTELEEPRPAELMDLSDDVLLYILRYCCPRDLKALGFTCPRLGRLIRDRTLWTRVDARSHPTGRARMRWLLAHALSSSTTELLLEGYAREARGCLGHVNRKRKEVEEEKTQKDKGVDPTASTSKSPRPRLEATVQIVQVDPVTRFQQLMRPNNQNSLQTPSRFSGTPLWPEDGPTEVDPEDVVLLDGSCPGPQFTLTQCMLRQLRAHCSLTSLALQYCNINCNTTGIAHFPPTLKKLSLRGAKCYNLPLDKSFLFNIQDYLPNLEYLDLSECEWLEPASFLPLSKVENLKHLIMKDCYRLSEFVAYASLATRYGFRKLETLDVRGSPVADSEVSALGWLPALRELYASPAPRVPPYPRDHSHYRDEPLPAHAELEPWEIEEPEYFKIKPQIVGPMDTRTNMTIDEIEEHIEQLRDYENNICLHGTEYNLCMEGIRKNTPRKRPAQSDSTEQTSALKNENPEPTTSMDLETAEPIHPPNKNTPKDVDYTDEIPGPSSKRKKLDRPFDDQLPSCSKSEDSKKNNSDDSSSDDDNAPLKILRSGDVNAGASTSNAEYEVLTARRPLKNNVMIPMLPEPPRCRMPRAHPSTCNCNNGVYEFVRFRHNMDPVIVRRDGRVVVRERFRARQNRDRQNQGRDNENRDRVNRDGPDRDRENRDGANRDRENSDAGNRDRENRAGANRDGENSDRENLDGVNRDREGHEKENRDGEGHNKNNRDKVINDSDQNVGDRDGSDERDRDSRDNNSQDKEDKDKNKTDTEGRNMDNNVGENRDAADRKCEDHDRDSNVKENSDGVNKDGGESSNAQNRDGEVRGVEIRDGENRDRENQGADNRDNRNMGNQGGDNRDGGNRGRQNRGRGGDREARPRAHVLYVNVGQQLHTVYRLSIHNEPPIFYSFAGNSHLRFRPNVSNIFYTPPTPHLDATSLVTDSAIRRFGRADVDDVNYIHIGPRPGPGDPGARPNRSSLRVLSVTGFRNITDRSLMHLATAAPDLRVIDFSETRVTAQGVENFRSLRPDCEVKFSEYVEREE